MPTDLQPATIEPSGFLSVFLSATKVMLSACPAVQKRYGGRDFDAMQRFIRAGFLEGEPDQTSFRPFIVLQLPSMGGRYFRVSEVGNFMKEAVVAALLTDNARIDGEQG